MNEIVIGRTSSGGRSFPLSFRVEYLRRWDECMVALTRRCWAIRHPPSGRHPANCDFGRFVLLGKRPKSQFGEGFRRG